MNVVPQGTTLFLAVIVYDCSIGAGMPSFEEDRQNRSSIVFSYALQLVINSLLTITSFNDHYHPNRGERMIVWWHIT
jgi:hypothetical protein